MFSIFKDGFTYFSDIIQDITVVEKEKRLDLSIMCTILIFTLHEGSHGCLTQSDNQLFLKLLQESPIQVRGQLYR